MSNLRKCDVKIDANIESDHFPTLSSMNFVYICMYRKESFVSR